MDRLFSAPQLLPELLKFFKLVRVYLLAEREGFSNHPFEIPGLRLCFICVSPSGRRAASRVIVKCFWQSALCRVSGARDTRGDHGRAHERIVPQYGEEPLGSNRRRAIVAHCGEDGGRWLRL